MKVGNSIVEGIHMNVERAKKNKKNKKVAWLRAEFEKCFAKKCFFRFAKFNVSVFIS